MINELIMNIIIDTR